MQKHGGLVRFLHASPGFLSSLRSGEGEETQRRREGLLRQAAWDKQPLPQPRYPLGIAADAVGAPLELANRWEINSALLTLLARPHALLRSRSSASEAIRPAGRTSGSTVCSIVLRGSCALFCLVGACRRAPLLCFLRSKARALAQRRAPGRHRA